MKQLIIIHFILLLSNFQLLGQTKIIRGKVVISEPSYEKGVDSKFYIMPDAFIFSEDTIKLGTTNEEGIFELQVPGSANKIIVSWIGYDFEVIELTGQCEFLEIILMPDVIYDFVTAKKAARLREKDRRILPELYRQAYEQGIIKQEAPCR